MTVYSDFKIYGPYTRADGRQQVILVDNSTKETKTVSYPKYLVEVYLNRYLDKDDTVDHIDGNFLNNELSNLRVVPRSEHCRSHSVSRKSIVKYCIICSKEFITNDNSRITCGSRQCRGRCAHLNGYNKGNSISREANNYVSNRSLIGEILSVEDANSVKALVANTEQRDDVPCV